MSTKHTKAELLKQIEGLKQDLSAAHRRLNEADDEIKGATIAASAAVKKLNSLQTDPGYQFLFTVFIPAMRHKGISYGRIQFIYPMFFFEYPKPNDIIAVASDADDFLSPPEVPRGMVRQIVVNMMTELGLPTKTVAHLTDDEHRCTNVTYEKSYMCVDEREPSRVYAGVKIAVHLSITRKKMGICRA